jgi:hypothetical protein
MKKLLFIICFGFLFLNTAFVVRGEEKIELCQADAYLGGLKCLWVLPISRLEHLPLWKENKGNPPLSVRKAISAARKWIATQNAYKSPGYEVESLLIRPILPSVNQSRSGRFSKYSDAYFYKIEFGMPPFENHITCVVLMDGTVLEPEYIKNPELDGK